MDVLSGLQVGRQYWKSGARDQDPWCLPTVANQGKGFSLQLGVVFGKHGLGLKRPLHWSCHLGQLNLRKVAQTTLRKQHDVELSADTQQSRSGCKALDEVRPKNPLYFPRDCAEICSM